MGFKPVPPTFQECSFPIKYNPARAGPLGNQEYKCHGGTSITNKWECDFIAQQFKVLSWKSKTLVLDLAPLNSVCILHWRIITWKIVITSRSRDQNSWLLPPRGVPYKNTESCSISYSVNLTVLAMELHKRSAFVLPSSFQLTSQYEEPDRQRELVRPCYLPQTETRTGKDSCRVTHFLWTGRYVWNSILYTFPLDGTNGEIDKPNS